MLRPLLFPLFALALPLLLSSNALAQQSSDEDYQAKMQELQRAISELKTELSTVKNTRDKLQQNLQRSEVDIGKLLKKIERLKGELASQKKQLTQLNQQRVELHSAKRDQQKHIAEHINTAYRLGNQSQLKLLLNQQDPAQVARTLRYYQYFLDARADQIDTYLDTIAELDTIEPRIQKRTAELETSRKRLGERHRQLSKRQAEREKALARLQQSIQRKDQQLAQMAQDKQQLQRLLDEVAATIANLALPGDGRPFGSQKGRLRYPTKGKIVQRFGSARAAGKLKWEGVLISSKEGTPVKAVHHGRVVFADYLRSYGLLVIVDHGDGYMSLYAHNQSLLKDTGDWVSEGDILAKVGNTGGQAQAGLYFEIRHQGKPTDPARWCRSA
ncbi:peptidoglycan DD-metalloendopeptidase family protein [Pseudomaricurvus alkylphenolicus]|jgi:septal ring factor EnvC (AmiA/AmiB activator)|uniref:murein hydrolase activator EnvC family protein n=1 Tax=Pseudomaricurvus alkylphenolicus TaxID=1306991 RepID=UPI00142400BD|nr:peptidoglycan DD-metalloendopeptidase family protein [Pseudomaricurvus alkylphenolicus]NIB39666.1 peptidoglycan DD-metalloendopeptidase family protein [Pseudomaricurvus alkylphenolicus]